MTREPQGIINSVNQLVPTRKESERERTGTVRGSYPDIRALEWFPIPAPLPCFPILPTIFKFLLPVCCNDTFWPEVKKFFLITWRISARISRSGYLNVWYPDSRPPLLPTFFKSPWNKNTFFDPEVKKNFKKRNYHSSIYLPNGDFFSTVPSFSHLFFFFFPKWEFPAILFF